MKRAPFLGAAAASVLAGCGGHHVMRALPGVASSAQSGNRASGSVRLVPEAADPIPQNVLASPIIGEARRFDGPTAPSGWLFAHGQAVNAADYPQLSSILLRAAARTRNATLTLPNPPFGLIIAAAGMFATSPAALAQSGRRFTAEASLGPGARPVAFRTISARFQALAEKRDVLIREQQRLAATALHPRPGPSIPITPDAAGRIANRRAAARTDALDRLSPANRGHALQLVEAIVEGRISTYQAQLEMKASLSLDEARALLDVNDAYERASRPGWAGMDHPEPQLDAARYIIYIVFTPEQLRAMERRDA